MSSDLRVVLLGKTGSGKSSTGNTILGEDVFSAKMCAGAVTKECQSVSRPRFERNITVIDTPGIFDTGMEPKVLKEEINKCIVCSLPGPHVFLLILRFDVRYTKEEINAILWIQDNFGEDAFKYTIILFTREDQLDEPVAQYIKENSYLKNFLTKYDNRYVSINNKSKDDLQVKRLMEKIDEMVELNGGHYTNEFFKEAQRRQQAKERMEWVKAQLRTLAVGAAGGLAVAVGPVAALVAATEEASLAPVAMAAGAAVGVGAEAAVNVVSAVSSKVSTYFSKPSQSDL